MPDNYLKELEKIYGALPDGAEQEIDPVTGEVLLRFGVFCSVPHGSGNEKELTDILAEQFGGSGRQVRIDDTGNLIVDIPASPGCEDAPVLMLQGHIDMVCAVRPGSDYVPESDPIRPRIRRDEESGRLILESHGDSSLGADCGLGDAAVLWLFDDELLHGPLRIVMTVREENGLGGALELSPEIFEGVRYVINVDGFNCGRFVAGSAGGHREKYRRAAEIVPAGQVVPDLNGAKAFEICISGFTGGHSGSDIAEGRVNAPWLMGRFLANLSDNGVRYALSSFTGGTALNAIPSDAQAVIAVQDRYSADFQRCLLELIENIHSEYSGTDDQGSVTFYETAMSEQVFSETCSGALIGLVSSLTVGVKKYMDEMPDTPETSCNLGVVEARAGSERMDVHLFERSIGGRSHEELLEEHRKLSERYGFSKLFSQHYPAWEYRQDNRLPFMAKEIFENETGQPGEVRAVHVGLEPAVFYGIDPHLQMVCMGADILDPHSIHERVHVDTIAPFARTLRRLVESIASVK